VWNGAPVVRPPLYGDKIYQGGVLVATIDDIPEVPDVNIFRDIDEPATATATIVSNTPIYKMQVNSAAVISNNLSGLAFNGNAAQWELWINFATTNALDSTFAVDMDFVGGEPDLTVTGCYKFACSVVSGGKISIKQTYPTVYDFTRQGNMAPVGSLAASTNATTIIALAVPDVLTYCVVYIKNSVPDSVYAITTPPYSKVGQTVVTTIKEQAIPTNAGTIVFMDKFTTADSLYNVNANRILLWDLEKTGTTNTGTPRCWAVTRPANELEIKAYEAGWRP
jgi:hypothetical protein